MGWQPSLCPTLVPGACTLFTVACLPTSCHSTLGQGKPPLWSQAAPCSPGIGYWGGSRPALPFEFAALSGLLAPGLFTKDCATFSHGETSEAFGTSPAKRELRGLGSGAG